MSKRFWIAIPVAIALAPLPSSAQLAQMRPDDAPKVGVELSKAFIGDSGLSWYTSTLRGHLLAPVGTRAYFLADWGVSIAGIESAGTDATFANPEVGIGLMDEEGRPRARLTAVLPLAFGVGDDDVSVGVGAITDVLWPERFVDELMSINVGFTPSAALGESTHFVADIVASALVPTGDGDTELFSRYGFGVEHDATPVRFRALIEGLAILSESDLSFGERTLHRLVLGLDGTEGGPGFFIQVPLDSDLDALDAVVGVNFTF